MGWYIGVLGFWSEAPPTLRVVLDHETHKGKEGLVRYA